MKFNRSISLGSLAAIAVSIALPSTALARPDQGQIAEDTGNTVHRVVHSLAANQEYTRETGIGYKWGQPATNTERASTWADSLEGQTGYKWGNVNTGANATAAKSFAEQAGSRWGRRNATEQAGSRWGRRNATEQAGSRWGRRNATEQAGSRWGRR